MLQFSATALDAPLDFKKNVAFYPVLTTFTILVKHHSIQIPKAVTAFKI